MSIYEHFSERELDILRARAQRAAKTSESNEVEETLTTALQIRLGSESYVLPVDALLAVYENLSVIPVPCTPPYIAGIANIRGRIMPVLDLAVLLNAPHSNRDVFAALLVVSRKDINLALGVDSVGEITTFLANRVASLPAGGDSLERAVYLLGLLSDGSILLNVEALFTDPTLIVQDAIS